MTAEEIARSTTANFRAGCVCGDRPDNDWVDWISPWHSARLGRRYGAGDLRPGQEDLEQVEREIALESVASVDAINYISQYLQSSGGKRLRPILVLLSAKLVGGNGCSAIQHGAVVEMIHTATLVHDDVIDAAKTRRGRPSTNVVWGNHTSRAGGRLAVHAGVPDGPAGAQFPRCSIC